MDVWFKAKGGERIILPGSIHVQVIRIIQEALTNVRKHSGRNQARFLLECKNEQVSIVIEDDGKGFDLVEIVGRDRRHVGLKVMRERAESIGGALLLDSKPGKGTRVMLELPLPTEKSW